jgi:RNA polymerase sigma-70 factor (ECF subfamily)
VQAAIAATHARALDPASVDWPLILTLYDQLLALNASPVVRLNRAVALAKVHGPAEALAAIAPIEHDPKLRHYHLLLAVRGQLLLDLGRHAEAADAFRSAVALACTEPERRFLRRKLDRCVLAD